MGTLRWFQISESEITKVDEGTKTPSDFSIEIYDIPETYGDGELFWFVDNSSQEQLNLIELDGRCSEDHHKMNEQYSLQFQKESVTNNTD